MKHIFLIYHPAVIFFYIAAAIVCAMLTMQPPYVLLSFAAASIYSIYLNGIRKYLAALKYLLVMFAIIAVLNPLFNHKGFTVLFMLGSSPVTLEALLYGLCAGGMLGSVLVWFQCYQKLVTNEKFLYLFGRVAPTSALVACMVLKWIPQMSYKMQSIKNAQAALLSDGDTGRKAGVKNSVRMTGILMSWGMEDSIETADSMRARGYGAAKRTTFSKFSFAAHDIVSMVILAALYAAGVVYMIIGGAGFMFYPLLTGVSTNLLGYVLYGAALLYPLILEGRERLLWRK